MDQKIYLYDDDIGCVEYVQHMGDDLTIVNAARVSFGKQKEVIDERDRKLIKYLELTWEDACLSPHKNKRSVRTASQQQVREKIYQGSSEAWRKYEPYINGAFDNLPSL